MSRYAPRTDHVTGIANALVSRWGRTSGVIRSIQRGTITITGSGADAVMSNTATITAVVVANCELHFLGSRGNDSRVAGDLARVELTNTTTVTAYGYDTVSSPVTVVSFEVVEYYSNVLTSNQSGNFLLTGVGSNTQAVTAVTLSKATLNFLGFSFTTDSAPNAQSAHTTLVLTNTTTLTAQRGGSSSNIRVGWNLVERDL